MDTKRTTPPSSYLSPSREEIRAKADEVELSAFSPELAQDLANVAAGGEVCPPSQYRSEVKRKAEENLPAPTRDGQWKLGPGEYTDDRQQAVNYRAGKKMGYHQRVSDFLKELDFSDVPGRTPLSQAMSLLKTMAEKDEDMEAGGEGESLPIFMDEDQSGEETAEEMNDLFDDVESLSEEEQELLEDEDTPKGPEGKRKLAEDMANGKDVWLEISRQLDECADFQARKSVELEPDPEGEEQRIRQMEDLSDLPDIQSHQWADEEVCPELFWKRAASREYMVPERCRREEQKQLLYMIVDCSGSMDNGDRIAKAGGVLMNRLKAVMEGEAELFCRFFDSSLYEEHHASNEEEAKELRSEFKQKNYSGGSTDIDGCSRQSLERIEELVEQDGLTRPELVVVTDGDDSVSLLPDDLGEATFHGFVVGGSNDSLLELAESFGGVGLEL